MSESTPKVQVQLEKKVHKDKESNQNQDPHKDNTNLKNKLSFSKPIIPVVFYSLPLRNVQDIQPGTGDFDYVQMLAKHTPLQKWCPKSWAENLSQVKFLQNIQDEQTVYQDIQNCLKQYPVNPNIQLTPILHLFINEPRTGATYTSSGLQNFKNQGGMVVVTAIEFRKYYDKNDIHRKNTILRLKDADYIIFLDEPDKRDALRYVTLSPEFQHDDILREKILTASVIPVPATVMPTRESKTIEASLNPLPLSNKNKVIIVPGMIRAGKGYPHVIEVARLIKNSNNPKMNEFVIIVAGTVQNHDKNNKELHQLMIALYPEKKSEIENKSINELKTLLTQFKQLEKDGKLQADLPMQILVDLPINDLSYLFSRSEYAFLPFFRGATIRNSTFCTTIAHGIPIISHESEITDPILQKNGEYNGAMLFVPGNLYNTTNYTQEVFNLIARYEEHPKSKMETQTIAKQLFENVIHPDVVGKKHAIVYKALLMKKLSPKERLNLMSKTKDTDSLSACRLANQDIVKCIFIRLKNEVEKKKSSKLITMLCGRDLDSLCYLDKKLLDERLRNHGTGSYFDSGTLPLDMINYLNKNRRKKAILTSVERRIVQMGLSLDWLSHSLTPSIDAIIKTGQLLAPALRRSRGEIINWTSASLREAHENSIFFNCSVGDITHGQVETFKDYNTRIVIRSSNISANVLHGQWISDCVLAYFKNRLINPVKIFDCIYWITYKKSIDAKTGQVLYKKIRHFSHSGRHYEDETSLGEEFFMEPFIERSVMHLIIKILRFMPVSTLLKVADFNQEQLTDFIQVLLDPKAFELLKPGILNIYEPGISIQPRTSALEFRVSDDFNQQMSNTIIPAIIFGDNNKVLNWLQTGNNRRHIYTKFKCGEHWLDLFAVAVLAQNLSLVTNFCESVPPQGYSSSMSFFKNNKRMSIEVNELVFFSNNEAENILKVLLGEEKFKMLKVPFENRSLIIKQFMQNGIIIKKNTDYRNLYQATFWRLKSILQQQFFKINEDAVCQLIMDSMDAHLESFFLGWAVLTGSVPIVECCLKHGADINDCLKMDNYSNHDNFSHLPLGITPLQVATLYLPAEVSKGMVQFLLSYQGKEKSEHINIEQVYLSRHNKIGPQKIEYFEGATSLQLAVSKCNIDVVELLLKAKANINHENLAGNTAVHLAEQYNRQEIAKLLRNNMQTKQQDVIKLLQGAVQINQESLSQSATLNIEDKYSKEKLASVKIDCYQENLTYFILTGECEKGRFFACVPQKLANDYENHYSELPFPSCHVTTICPFVWLRDIGEKINKNLQGEVHRLKFSTSIPEDNTQYYTNIAVCDLGKCEAEFFERIKTFGLDFKFIYAQSKTIQKVTTNNSNGNLSIKFSLSFEATLNEENYTFHPFAKALLEASTYFFASQKEAKLFKNAAESNFADFQQVSKNYDLEKIYHAWRHDQHNALFAAERGDMKAMSELLENQSISIDYPVPYRSRIIDRDNEGNPYPRSLKYQNVLSLALYGKLDFSLANGLIRQYAHRKGINVKLVSSPLGSNDSFKDDAGIKVPMFFKQFIMDLVCDENAINNMLSQQCVDLYLTLCENNIIKIQPIHLRSALQRIVWHQSDPIRFRMIDSFSLLFSFIAYRLEKNQITLTLCTDVFQSKQYPAFQWLMNTSGFAKRNDYLSFYFQLAIESNDLQFIKIIGAMMDKKVLLDTIGALGVLESSHNIHKFVDETLDATKNEPVVSQDLLIGFQRYKDMAKVNKPDEAKKEVSLVATAKV